jgi:hypothetical protein
VELKQKNTNMKKLFLKKLAGFLMLAFALPAMGQSSVYFLSGLGTGLGGVREISLSGAGVASSGNAGTVWMNPAGLVSAPFSFIHFEEARLFPDVKKSLFQGTYQWKSSASGITLFHQGDNGISPADDEGVFDPNASFGSDNLLVAAQFAYSLDKISIGAGLKGFYETIQNYSRFGGAVDLGARYEWLPGRFYSGISLLNLGKAGAFVSEAEILPVTIKGGFSYVVPVHLFSIEAMLDVVDQPLDQIYSVPAALEIKYRDLFFIRGGYPLLQTPAGFSLGFGVNIRHFQIDYGIVLAHDDFEPEHALGLTIWGY